MFSKSKNKANAEILANAKSIHDFTFETLKGQTFDFASLKGKYILIVNTASKCGFTPQYKGLQELRSTNQDKIEVIGFPCDNFAHQEPGSPDEIEQFCEVNFGIEFPLMQKSNVTGDNINAIFEFLVSKSKGNDVLWNFEKFLISPEGNLVERFRSTTKPTSDKITRYLK